jgi:WD40 repeat protein
MNRSLAPHVFVSYSREDESFLRRLVADLQAHGIMVWIDKSGIPPGTPDWEDALRAAISTSQAIILIASPNSRSSLYVRDELSLAKRYKHQIYPIWVDGTEWIDCIPLGCGGMQYIDARGSLYKSALNDLVVALDTLSAPSQLTKLLVTSEDFSWHCIRTLTGHRDTVTSVAMSADGQMLASGSEDKTIKLWEKK